MTTFALLLNLAAPFAAFFILTRAGCTLNRMRWRSSPPLWLAYIGTGISALCVVLVPFYGDDISDLAYPALVINMAAVIALDRRLRHRLDLNALPPGEIS